MHVTLISADEEIWATGIRSISAALRRAGHQTTMILAGAREVPIGERVAKEIAALAQGSDIIGISSMCRGSLRAKELIRALRPLGKLIVWGGIHPTLFPDDCTPHADLVCRGEGEGFMLELVERVAQGQGFTDIQNGAYLSGDSTVQNELRPLIADLDDLPLLDFAFENEYILNSTGRLHPNGGMRERTGNVLFSGTRGCQNSCAYCSNSQLKAIYRGKGRPARKMSIPKFVDAAREYRRLFPQARLFYFTDEDFFDRPVEEMRQFADMYPGPQALPFECMASPRQITEEKVALAVKAGLWRIDVGLESGSQRVRREVFNRLVDDQVQINAATAIDAQAPGRALYFLILGNPYEERLDLLNGVRLLGEMPTPFFLRAYNLVFIPGTKLFDRACRDGIIAGIGDSAFDIDFLAGFDHSAHDWKRGNLYLNALISLMQGRHTRWRLGFVPRAVLPVLINSRVVGFCEHHAGIGDKIVSLANIAMKIRRLAGRWLDRVDRDAPPLPALPVSQVATQCAGRTSVG
ncbi:MAG: radical SAM protein [Gaiellales bacterium]|nr:radical SAM protein [Gaiellales bacterium]